MRYIFNGLNLGVDNFRLKFSGTTIYIKVGKQEPMLVYIVDAGREGLYVDVIETNKRELIINDIVIVKTMPDQLGYLNTSYNACFLVKAGERQQKQGFCYDRVKCVLGKIESLGQLHQAYLPNTFKTIKEAAKLLLRGNIKLVALSPNFALDNTWKIHYRKLVVGHYSYPVVFMDDELMDKFKDEVKYG